MHAVRAARAQDKVQSRCRWASLVVGLAAAGALTGSVHGATIFKVADGDWNSAGSWYGGVPPAGSAATNPAIVGSMAVGGRATATARIARSTGADNARISLIVGDEATTNGTVVATAGTTYFKVVTIGNAGTGTFTATNPTMYVYNLSLGGSSPNAKGTLNLTNTTLNVDNGVLNIGNAGTGTLNQVGGVINVKGTSNDRTVYLGALDSTPASEGTYNLSGGGMLSIVGSATSPAALHVGRNGKGTFNIGDSTSGGTVTETEATTNYVRFDIGSGSSSSAGSSVNGWGAISLRGAFTNRGIITANGYGTDRPLDISQYSSISATAGGSNGYYAINHGRLNLKDLTVNTATSSYFWGQTGTTADKPSLVNAAKVTFTGLSATNQTLGISLLATDRAELHAGLTNPIGFWEMAPGSGIGFTSATLAFRYDEALAAKLGVAEAKLGLYQYAGGSWHLLPATLDAEGNVLTATGVTSLSQFVIAAVPEPLSASVLALSLCLVLRGRPVRR